jgi:uncharacterized protein (DUF952 family)
MIYHVVAKSQWQQALAQGFYEAPSLAVEGFIHLSKQVQVQGVLNRYYLGQTDLLLLHVDESKLAAPLKYELAPSVNEAFPHLFGTLNIDAVVEVTEIVGV